MQQEPQLPLESSRASLIARMLTALGVRFAGWVERYEVLAISAAIAAFLFVTVLARRPLWCDEFFTLYTSNRPDIGQMFRAIPADGNPPLSYILVRASLRLFGETEFALRLPSMLGFAGAMLATYLVVRRRCGAAIGLFAMLALSVSGMAFYGNEARPYGLMLGFTGLTIASWQAAAERSDRRLLPLAGVAIGIAGAVGSHHYGVFHVGVPLVFGEAVRLARRRRFDFPLYCACAGGLSVLALTLPLARQTNEVLLENVRQSAVFWAKPTFRSLRSYKSMAIWWLPAALAAALWLTRAAVTRVRGFTEPHGRHRGLPAHELAAAIGLALLVPIMILITRSATGYFMPRYAIGAAMGIAILCGFAAYFWGRSAAHGAAVASLCVFLLGAQLFAPAFRAAAKAVIGRVFNVRSAPPAPYAILQTAPGRDPIVIASALNYMPAWWYAPPQLRERLRYLADLRFALGQPDFLPEFSLVLNRNFIPSKVEDYQRFLSTHRRFLLYCNGESAEWTKERLQAEGWSLRVFRARGDEILFAVEAPHS